MLRFIHNNLQIYGMKTITFLGILGVFPEKQGHFGDGGNPKFKRFFEGSPNEGSPKQQLLGLGWG